MAAEATMKIAILALAYVTLMMMMVVKEAHGQKCKNQPDTSIDWELNIADFIVAYNISNTKAEQTCYDIFEAYISLTDDRATFVYKVGDASVKRTGRYIVESNKPVTLVFDDSPNDKIDAFAEQPVNGTVVLYLCTGNQQSILVVYDSKKPELAAVADDLAKGLTDKNLADFKIARDNC